MSNPNVASFTDVDIYAANPVPLPMIVWLPKNVLLPVVAKLLVLFSKFVNLVFAEPVNVLIPVIVGELIDCDTDKFPKNWASCAPSNKEPDKNLISG